MDASTIAVGEYDEDQDEVFIGPGFLDGEEEEYYDEDEYDEEDYSEEQTGAPDDAAQVAHLGRRSCRRLRSTSRTVKNKSATPTNEHTDKHGSAMPT